MRIGIDGRILQEAYRSGIPEYSYRVIRGMALQHPEDTFVVFYNSFRNVRKHIPEMPHNVEVRVFRAPNKLLEIVWPFLPYPKIDKLINVDVFFSPHIYYIPLSKTCRRIITSHDLSFIRDPRYFSWPKNIWHILMRPGHLLKRADRVIAVSSSTSRDLVNLLSIDPKKIIVIPHGYDKQEHQSHVPTPPEIEPFLFYMSTLEPRKNAVSLVHAHKMLTQKENSSPLILLAGKKGWLSHRDQKTISSEPRIRALGFLDRSFFHYYYSRCLAFLFVPWHEGFGMALLDALMFHKPIITSAVSSIPEVIKDHGIQINPHMTGDIASAMHEVATHAILRETLSQKTRSFDAIGWDLSAEQTYQVLSKSTL